MTDHQPTTNRKDVRDQLHSLWATFQNLAARAEHEAKANSDGRPDATTDFALSDLSDRLDMLEEKLSHPTPPGALFTPEGTKQFTLNGATVAYQTGTPAHARFLRVLRNGLTSRDFDRLPISDLSDTTRDALKAMRIADDTTGGFLASDEFASDLLRRSVDRSPARQLVRVIPFGSSPAMAGSDSMLVPVRMGIGTAVRVSETGSRTPSTSGDLSFALERIPSHEMLCSTKLSRALLSDSLYPIDAELADAAAASFAVLEGYEFIKGTGNGEMLGLVNMTLPAGQVQTTTGTSSSIAPADLFDVQAKLKPQYLPNAKFILNATSMFAVRKLRSDNTNGPFLYQPGLGGLSSSTICDLPFVLCPDLDSPGSSGKHVAFLADWQQAYAIAVRQDVQVVRLNELYAESGQVAFLVLQRTGGQPANIDAIARLTTGS